MKTDHILKEQRRAVHGGAAPLPPAVGQADTGSPTLSAARPRRLRGILVGRLVGLLIVMVLLLKWLVHFQVEIAAQRRAQQAAVRAAWARCFEQASNRAIDACMKDMSVSPRQAD
ncbi:hypothetical protein ACSFBX_34130 [Variovorax sp. RB2P76]|uniref:hypothetical protein n=1 Tax=unclassified Variovorax TaxID=663243 RepID=UPI003F488F29